MSENEENDSRKILTKKMNESKKMWISTVKMLTNKLREGDVKYASDIQSEAISYRQSVVDEVNTYAVKIHKLDQKIKVLHKARFEFYVGIYYAFRIQCERE